MLSLSQQCLGGLQRPVIDNGYSSFFLPVSFLSFNFFSLFSLFLPTQSDQLHALFNTAFHYDPYIQTLMPCDD